MDVFRRELVRRDTLRLVHQWRTRWGEGRTSRNRTRQRRSSMYGVSSALLRENRYELIVLCRGILAGRILECEGKASQGRLPDAFQHIQHGDQESAALQPSCPHFIAPKIRSSGLQPGVCPCAVNLTYEGGIDLRWANSTPLARNLFKPCQWAEA